VGTTNISRTAPAYGVKEHAPVTGVVLRILYTAWRNNVKVLILRLRFQIF